MLSSKIDLISSNIVGKKFSLTEKFLSSVNNIYMRFWKASNLSSDFFSHELNNQTFQTN